MGKSDIKLNYKDKMILDFLKKHKAFNRKNAISPTKIGISFKQNYNNASSWACSSVKKMKKFKILKRTNLGTYYLGEGLAD